MGLCSSCGKEVKEHDQYCKHCGAGQAGGDLSGKKARVMSGKSTSRNRIVLIAAVAILLIVGLWFAKGVAMRMKMGTRPMFAPMRDTSARLTRAEAVMGEAGVVRIPLARLGDGNAHFFAYRAGDKTVTFFAMKAGDGSIRTAYDACMACNHAKLGYRQEGGTVVCNNCGMGFKPGNIGMTSGGCNPIPLAKTVDGAYLAVTTKDLEAGAQYF